MTDKVVEKYSIQAPTFACSTCPTEISPGGEYFSAIVFEQEAFLRREVCPICWEKRTVDTEAAFAYWKTRRPEPRDRRIRRRFDIELLWQFFAKLERDLEEEPIECGAEPDPPAAALSAPPPEDDAAGEECGPTVTGDDAVHDDASHDGPEGKSPDETAEEAEAGPPAPLGRDEKVGLCFLLALLLLRGKRFVLRETLRSDGAEFLRLTEKADPETEHLVEDPHLAREDLERVKRNLGELLQMEI